MGLYTCCRIPRQLWGTGPSLQPRTFVQRRFRPHVDVRLGADKGKLCPAPSQKILRRAWCNGGQASAASDDAAAGFDINLGGYDPEEIMKYFKRKPLLLFARAILIGRNLVSIMLMLLTRDYARLAETVGDLGPTYIKFGQALASRSDIVGRDMAAALAALQDDLPPFPDAKAMAIVEEELPEAAAALQGPPVAAASLCQVYRGRLRGRDVAIKVQRPGIRLQVAADAVFLRFVASALERSGVVKAKAVAAVDEFVARIFEEMDFENEAANLRRFASLYCRGGTAARTLPPPGVRVPELIGNLVSTRVLVMEWLEGEKLTEDSIVPGEDLPLVELGIRCTLSQLIETGVMHADPHGGNLLKLPGGSGLAYIDFGIVSEVPLQVREGLVAAVALIVFTQDYPAVARLFGELMLIPPEVANDEEEMEALASELSSTAASALVFPEGKKVPEVRFDQLLVALAGIVPRFRFVLPPYFVNNARALGTLEGMARSADPNFNIIGSVYPFALRRLLSNPSGSPVLRHVVRRLAASKDDGRLSISRLGELLDDASAMSGLPRSKVVADALRTREGRALAAEAMVQGVIRLLEVRGPHRLDSLAGCLL